MTAILQRRMTNSAAMQALAGSLHDGDGLVDVAEYYDADQRLVKAGFSLAGDGVIDAWA